MGRLDRYSPLGSSARVSQCDKCCFSLASFTLQIFNAVNFALGCVLLAYAVYLYEVLGMDLTDPESAWFGWTAILLGALLLLESLTSFCAISTRGCRWAIHPSKILSGIIGVLSAVLGALGLALRKTNLNYIDDHQDSLGLTDKEVQTVKNWYLVMACSLLVLFLIEVARLVLSSGYDDTAVRMDGEFDALMAEEDQLWQERMDSNHTARKKKYKDLRAYYKAKYGNPDV